MTKHPMQPLELVKGVLRFKRNPIVDALLDHGSKTGLGLNELVRLDANFSKEDWSQFAQLIGYSHSGASAYMTNDELDAAMAVYESGTPECEAKLAIAEQRLCDVRDGLRETIANLYDIHPDELQVKPASRL